MLITPLNISIIYFFMRLPWGNPIWKSLLNFYCPQAGQAFPFFLQQKKGNKKRRR